jgi:hypothetical protein
MVPLFFIIIVFEVADPENSNKVYADSFCKHANQSMKLLI